MGPAVTSSAGSGTASGAASGVASGAATGSAQPLILISGLGTPRAIALDSTSAYWTNGFAFESRSPIPREHAVFKCAKTGCNNLPTILAGGLNSPRGIAVDSTNVYWADIIESGVYPNNMLVGTVMKCAVNGCNDKPTILASMSNSQPIDIAVDATSVYWTLETVDVVPTSRIMKCAIAGCNNQPTVLLSSNSSISSIAVNSSGLYWARLFSIYKCAVGGCTDPLTPLFGTGTAAFPVAIAVDSMGVHWTGELSAGGAIQECALDGSQFKELSAWDPSTRSSSDPRGVGEVGYGRAYGIAADSASVYWTESNAVLTCAAGGCNHRPTLLGSGPKGRAVGVAVDSTGVYWTNEDPTDGTVMSVAK